jgi:cobalt-zinc-cadmium efflux system outer membrane protein
MYNRLKSHPMQKIAIVLTGLILLFGTRVKAQTAPDTTRFSLPEAEKIFLQKNLSLLAAKYNIDANKALIEQAKLWDNPILATDQNIYDGKKGDGKFFTHTSDRGQIFIQVTQLIKTAGKRTKLAQLATDNTTLASEQFNDIMRSLRYTLRSDLLEINHQLKLKKVYDGEITELQRLIKGMDEELKAGNIALKDNMRLKALLFNLQNELVNIESAIMPVQSELKLLLQITDSSFIAPTTAYQFGSLTTDAIPAVDSLVRLALASRPDARIAQTAIDFQNHNLIYQKALAKPDVTIGTEYDQHSSYNPNYIGLSVALPLNIFNRNQGNIKFAEFSIKQQETLNTYQYSKIENEVNASFNKLKYFQQVNNLQQLDFSRKYDDLFQNMLKTYQARQISLLEFIDFIDSYKDTKLKLVEQHNSLVKSIEELNFTTNSTIITIQ